MKSQEEVTPGAESDDGRSLSGRVAVVAGATRGIGKGIAIELGLAGAHVIVTGRTVTPSPTGSRGSLQETVEEITRLGGSATALRCDFSDLDDIAGLFVAVAQHHPRIDILVNSVFDARTFEASKGKPFWQLPIDIWHDVVTVGARSAYASAVHAAPLMIGGEGSKGAGGALMVNVSGRGAERYMYNVAYGVGKASLDKMTRDMAADLKDEGVTVVSLWPNVTRTETLDAAYSAQPSVSVRFGDPSLLETPRYAGRAVVALANDPARQSRSGRRFWVAALAAEYGVVDEHGRSHEIQAEAPAG